MIDVNITFSGIRPAPSPSFPQSLSATSAAAVGDFLSLQYHSASRRTSPFVSTTGIGS